MPEAAYGEESAISQRLLTAYDKHDKRWCDAEQVPGTEIENGICWYIPHHGIYHHKKPTKMRFVFDCSCTYRGTSLNKVLLQEPNLLNNLI